MANESQFYAFVIEYHTHDGGYHAQQSVAVCGTLERAIRWLEDENKGKSWSHLSYMDGEDERTRLITEFSEEDWSSYNIRKKPLFV